MFNEKYDGHYFVHRDMLINLKPWDDKDGDALWRTSIGLICYNEWTLYAGILSCFVSDGDKELPLRFPYNPTKEPELYQWARDTCSRDQVAMAIVALRWTGNVDFNIAKKIPWQISKKHSMTPDLWLWLHEHYNLWLVLVILQFMVIVPWNQFWRRFYKEPGWVGKVMYPHYSLFITVFMLAVVPDGPLVRLARFIIRQEVEPSNYVLQILCGVWPNLFDMLAYEAKSFRWNRRLDEPAALYLPEDRKLEYNNIDIDMLYEAIKWGNKNIPEKLAQVEPLH